MSTNQGAFAGVSVMRATTDDERDARGWQPLTVTVGAMSADELKQVQGGAMSSDR